MKRLAVIDGKSIFYRGYYAMPGLSLPDGTPTGGVFGFASLAIELIKKLEPDYVAVAWDKPKTNIRKRRQIYPEYKAGRKAPPPDFYAQIPLLRELLDAFHWPLYELDDYEADDIMGAFAVQAEGQGIETCLITSDLDSLQLIAPHTKVYAIKSGLTNIEEFDVAYFEQKYGIKVEQFLDLKSLKGDSSDNIPGVPGIGEKTATGLLQEFGTLDGIYEHLDDIKPSVANKLNTGKESAYMSKEIATIWVDAPAQLDLEAMDVTKTDFQKVADILTRFEFRSLVNKLPDHMSGGDQVATKVQAAAMAVKQWPKTLHIDGPVAVAVNGGKLWLSVDNSSLYSLPVDHVDSTVWRTLELATVVAYDIKNLLYEIGDIELNLGVVHDVRQAEFLLNPLRRDRDLDAITGMVIDSPESFMSALWSAYSRQKDEFRKLPSLDKLAHEMDFPLQQVLYRIESRGIGIEPKIFESLLTEINTEYTKLEQDIYTSAGREFNIGSPSQLAEVLFVNLGLPTTGIKRGKTGYSTDQKTLDKLRSKHEIIGLVERARELAKIRNTYVETLPTLADKNGRIHTTFSQDVASTGRLSSSDPNLQNIPVRSELGRKIRTAFVPRKGNVFVSADYSQFELRLAAVLSGDKELIDDFGSGVDIHTKTASQVYGVLMEDVTKKQRRDAKVINFGVLYGMGPHALAENTGMTFGAAKQFIDQYFALRAPIRKFIDDTLQKADTEGYVETYYGRRRPTPDVKSSNFMVRESAKRAAANLPIQGTEADLMKRAMIRVEESLGDLGQQILQIHDSIMVECPEENATKVGDLLRDIMQNIAPELEIKLAVDVNIGHNWGEV